MKKTLIFEESTKQGVSKRFTANTLGISRERYTRKQDLKDEELKEQILKLREEHPNHGYRRLAIALEVNKKRVRRVCQKFKLQKKRRASKPFKTSSKENDKYPNLLVNLKPISSNLVWATDFTYLKFKNKFFHLATFIDIYSQKIVGFNISDKHDTELILRAFREAVKKENTSPEIIHSDQGSEYCGEEYYRTLKEKNIKISMSSKASPWQNGFQESYYRGFKEDLGSIKDCLSIGELLDRVFKTIHYYNNLRIHSALKMSPQQFLELKVKSGITGS